MNTFVSYLLRFFFFSYVGGLANKSSICRSFVVVEINGRALQFVATLYVYCVCMYTSLILRLI